LRDINNTNSTCFRYDRRLCGNLVSFFLFNNLQLAATEIAIGAL